MTRIALDLGEVRDWMLAHPENYFQGPIFEAICNRAPEFRQWCERQRQKGCPERVFVTMLLMVGPDPSDDIEDYLRWCERGWREGSLEHLIGAVEVCNKKQLALPSWAAKGVTLVLTKLFFSSENAKHGGEAFYWKNRVHAQRWRLVKKLRSLSHDDFQLRYGRKNAWKNVWDIVAEKEAVAVATVKTSYHKVQRARKNGHGARYYLEELEIDLG